MHLGRRLTQMRAIGVRGWLVLLVLALAALSGGTPASAATNDSASRDITGERAARNQIWRAVSRFGRLVRRTSSCRRRRRFVRAWLPKREPNKIYFFVIPDSLSPSAGKTASDSGGEWWQKFVEPRKRQADALFRQKKALAAHEPAQAYDWCARTVRRIPIISAGDGYWVIKNPPADGSRRMKPASWPLATCSTTNSAGCRPMMSPDMKKGSGGILAAGSVNRSTRESMPRSNQAGGSRPSTTSSPPTAAWKRAWRWRKSSSGSTRFGGRCLWRFICRKRN